MNSTFYFSDSNKTGASLIKLKRVDSTNHFLETLNSEEDLAHGTVVCAEFQSAGRGMHGNAWFSNEGKNLLCSFLYKKAPFHISRQFYLSKCLSLALADILTDLLPGSKIEIKWPNDIFVSSKKICGMLIKSSIKNESVTHAICGIGLNVNETDFPANLNATSLFLESGKEFKLSELLQNLLEKINVRLEQFLSNKTESIDFQYHQKLLGYNVWLTYADTTSEFTGRIREIREDGRMILEKSDGSSGIYEVKEIALVSK
jgi:BirA family biotin operon repressor/biotin-[acetyl-CoA-carboxylase] ligase